MERKSYINRINKAFSVLPVVAILGPRQAGKSTLARQWVADHAPTDEIHYFDLEDDTDLERLRSPQLTLDPLRGTVVIDEIQRVPDLFARLRVLADRQKGVTRYLMLGSASRDLIRQSSETLAGRIAYIELTPFTLQETGAAALRTLWLRGGFPLSFLAGADDESLLWRKSYIKSYLERDIPSLGIRIPAESLRRFWMMLTHVHGQMFNAADIGRSMGMDGHTMRRYLDILSGTFMIRPLQPWFENIGKRQIKSPKMYFRDSGIFHALLGLATHDDLLHHPKMGASWEGFALEEIIRLHNAEAEDVYFWGTHNQAELDLLILKDGRRIGYEIKYTSTPRITRSLRIAQKDLRLDIVRVVFPGQKRFPIGEAIEAVGLETLLDDQDPS